MAAPLVFTPGPDATPGCELCRSAGGLLLWQGEGWRVVRVEDADFPAFYRVICNHHVREFSELLAPERQRCMDLVCAVERVLIEQLRPTKVNLAALGNMVAHLHWHVVARFDWDSRFPRPIWSETVTAVPGKNPQSRLATALPDVDHQVVQALASL
jgi:diadenosine tetraphosphate (Ap4A) HIT family hydrolase